MNTAMVLILPAILLGYTAAQMDTGLLLLMPFSLSLYLLLLILYRCSGRLILSCFRAQPIANGQHPELTSITGQLAQRAGISPPRLFIIESNTPNAFAVGRAGHNSAVAVTRGLIGILEKQELAGVIAHELAHLKQGQAAIPAPATSAITGCAMLLANLLRAAMLHSAGRRGVACKRLMTSLATAATTLEQLVSARSREFAADAMGAQLCGDPLWLADALRKVRTAEVGLLPSSPTRPGSHPLVGERIRRLEAMAYGAYI